MIAEDAETGERRQVLHFEPVLIMDTKQDRDLDRRAFYTDIAIFLVCSAILLGYLWMGLH